MRLKFSTAAFSALLAIGLLMLLAPAAEAGHWKKRHHHWGPGWHHGNSFHGFHGRQGRHRHSGVGASIVFGSPRTVYVERPPRVIYVDPAPRVVQSPGYLHPGYAPPSPSEGRYCREVNKTVLIDGRMQNAYGKACYQPDGSWEWVDD
ncbi:MAG: hypothetical protein WD341_05295 [Tistlia sp.]|uniref:hypothetical protein n=1 Tax=Tistlia sp. TaxID=3057121 RepID=UPI0034A30094